MGDLEVTLPPISDLLQIAARPNLNEKKWRIVNGELRASNGGAMRCLALLLQSLQHAGRLLRRISL